MWISRLWFLIVFPTLTACSLGGPSKPAHFYALSAAQGASPGAGPPAYGVGIGPVSLPEMYDRPQIVTRPDANQVELAEYDRWSGSLGKDVTRVLMQNLISRLNDDTIVTWPWQRHEAPALQVAVRFFRFDGVPGGEVHLTGVWQLLDASEDCRLAVHRFNISRQTDGPAYADYVRALSLGLAQLSDAIAERLAVAVPGCRGGLSPSAVDKAPSKKAINERPPLLGAEQRGWAKGRDETFWEHQSDALITRGRRLNRQMTGRTRQPAV
jgi:hypothetical protein